MTAGPVGDTWAERPCRTSSSRSTAAMSARSGTATSASSRAVRSSCRVVPMRAEASAMTDRRRRARSASMPRNAAR